MSLVSQNSRRRRRRSAKATAQNSSWGEMQAPDAPSLSAAMPGPDVPQGPSDLETLQGLCASEDPGTSVPPTPDEGPTTSKPPTVSEGSIASEQPTVSEGPNTSELPTPIEGPSTSGPPAVSEGLNTAVLINAYEGLSPLVSPSASEGSSVSEQPTVTEGLNTSELPLSDEGPSTSVLPTTAEGLGISVSPTPAEGPSTSVLTTVSEGLGISVPPTSSEGLSNLMPPTLSEGPGINVPPPSGEGPSTSVPPTTSEGPDTSVLPPSGEGPSTSVPPTTSDGLGISVPPPSSKGQITSVLPSSGKGPITSVPPTDSEGPGASEPPTRGEVPSTSVRRNSGEGPSTSGMATAAEDPSTSGMLIVAEGPSTSGMATATEGQSTSEMLTVGEGPSTFDMAAAAAAAEGPSTSGMLIIAEGPSTSGMAPAAEGPSTSEMLTVGEGPSTFEMAAAAAAEGPSTSGMATAAKGPNTSEMLTVGEGPSTFEMAATAAAAAAEGPSTSGMATAAETPSTSGMLTIAEGPSISEMAAAAECPSTSGMAAAAAGPSTSGMAAAADGPSTSGMLAASANPAPVLSLGAAVGQTSSKCPIALPSSCVARPSSDSKRPKGAEGPMEFQVLRDRENSNSITIMGLGTTQVALTLKPQDPMEQNVAELLQFLLVKDQSKYPIRESEMRQYIVKEYRSQFPEILRRAAAHLECIFRFELRELDPEERTYILLNKLGPVPFEGLEENPNGPKMGLLMMILGQILLNGNQAKEAEIWEMLWRMGVQRERRLSIFGNPKRLLSVEFVWQRYLDYRPITDRTPVEYEFFWGPRSHIETSKMKILKFMAKIYNKDPSDWPEPYNEALEEEAARAYAEGWQALPPFRRPFFEEAAEVASPDFDVSAYPSKYPPHSWPESRMESKSRKLVQLFLLMDSTKLPIPKKGILYYIGRECSKVFPDLLNRAARTLNHVYGTELVVLDPRNHSYTLYNRREMEDTEEIVDSPNRPGNNFLMQVLSFIFIMGNHARESAVWAFLRGLGVQAGRKHVITCRYLSQRYIDSLRVPDSDPVQYEFVWGPRARLETSKMKALRYVARIHRKEPQDWPEQYREAMEDEANRADAGHRQFLVHNFR
ncbi:melanoma-associated antigen E1 [Marmota flaviventris]|uniref:melanoma-associated antigen E1 n=1 Tax=Marmota flaviventris TaxID=93162 RepID=UPI003A861764